MTLVPVAEVAEWDARFTQLGPEPVVQYPADVLAQVAQPVTEHNDGLGCLWVRLRETRRHLKGLGVAAPQIGVPARVFVMCLLNGTEHVVVNPTIQVLDDTKVIDQEGCLSLVGAVPVGVARYKVIGLRGTSVDGSPVAMILKDLEARIVQHEIDHLDGRLIIDRVSRQQRRYAIRSADKHAVSERKAATKNARLRVV